MAKSRRESGARFQRGVLLVPRGTIEGLQFCRNGVLRSAISNNIKRKEDKNQQNS